MYTVYYKLYAQQASLAKFLFESLKVQNTPFGKTPVVLNVRCPSSFKNLKKKTTQYDTGNLSGNFRRISGT